MKTDMIYLDNSATTPLCDKAKQAMIEAIEHNFGNPSSLHRVGLDAEHAIEHARSQIWTSLGLRGPVKKNSIIFTSGGSEANNLAILGAAGAKKRRGIPKIITTEGEHSSVEECVKRLEEQGWCAVRIRTVGGSLDMEQLKSELTSDVAIVSLMAVNNETGALYNIKDALASARRACPDAVLHVDAIQAYQKIKPVFYMSGADLVSISAHKIHGPKGVGALYVSPEIIKARKLSPIIVGGGQESGLRSGTENTVGIIGFGAAAEEATSSLTENSEKISALREYLISKFEDNEKLSEIKLNLPDKAAPHILNFTLPSIRSETMLHYLEQFGIYLSSGSACSSHTSKVSRALSAFGLDAHASECSLRVSLSAENTKDELNELILHLESGVSALVRIR